MRRTFHLVLPALSIAACGAEPVVAIDLDGLTIQSSQTIRTHEIVEQF